MGKTSSAVKNRYNAKAYDRVSLMLPKGRKQVVEAHAEGQGETVNGFIKRAIDETMQRDNAIAPEHKHTFLIGRGVERIASAIGESARTTIERLIAARISDEDIISAGTMTDNELNRLVKRITAQTSNTTT